MFASRFRSDDKVLVKICGITNEPDALAAIDPGADALGFNLIPQSKRYIDIAGAASWIAKLPLEICKVAVMADPNWEDTCRIVQIQLMADIRLHSNESPELGRR